jgi:hypothetical protein
MLVKTQAAVTFSFANYTSSANGPNGLPFVDSEGAAILNSSNSLFASIGYLSPVVDPIADNTIAGTLARFVAIDSTPIVPSLSTPVSPGPSVPRNGLINGQDYTSALNVYPSGFQGKIAVVFIGNSATILDSTQVAMFTFTEFLAPDAGGNRVQNFQLTSSSTPTIGTLRSVTTQPVAGNAYLNGVMLVPVPETSTSLLGAIGALALLRRRRNA